jgi:hypothetical protein
VSLPDPQQMVWRFKCHRISPPFKGGGVGSQGHLHRRFSFQSGYCKKSMTYNYYRVWAVQGSTFQVEKLPSRSYQGDLAFLCYWHLFTQGVKRSIWVRLYHLSFAFRRLGWAYSRLCWISLHSIQPTHYRYYCQMRNPKATDFGTEFERFFFRSDCTLAARGDAHIFLEFPWSATLRLPA